MQGQEQEQEGGFKARAANQVDAERHRATPVQEEERSGGVGGVVGGGKRPPRAVQKLPGSFVFMLGTGIILHTVCTILNSCTVLAGLFLYRL